jgi:hypothetical protein
MATMPPATLEDAELERRRREESGVGWTETRTHGMPPAPVVPSAPGSRNYNLSVGATEHPKMPPAFVGPKPEPTAPDLSKMPPANFAPPSASTAAPAKPQDVSSALGMPPAGLPSGERSTAFSKDTMPPAGIGQAEKHEQELRQQGRPGSPEGPDLPWWKRVLDTVAQSHPIGRLVERNIPGSPGNFDWELARATAAGEKERGAAKAAHADDLNTRNVESEIRRRDVETQKIEDTADKPEHQDIVKEFSDALAKGDQARIDALAPRVKQFMETSTKPGTAEKSTKEQLQRQIADADAKGDKATVKTLQDRLKAIDPEGQQRIIIQQGNVADKKQNAKDIAEGIISGDQPPTLTGLRENTAQVRAELQRRGFNLARAESDWHAVQKHLASLNGSQQLRLRQAVSFTDDSLGTIETLYDRWKQVGPNSGWKVFNKAGLEAAKQLPGEAGEIANRLEARVADLTSELGTVYKGGNSSTDESLKLADKNLQTDWNERTFAGAIKDIRQSLEIRKSSIRHSEPAGVSDNSPYVPSGEKEDSGGSGAGKKGKVLVEGKDF